MTKKEILVMIIEIACCLIGALPVRIILTIVKNLLKIGNTELMEEV